MFGWYICFYFRVGVVRAATIEEIEAEKSLIEKDVVSFFYVMVDFRLVCGLAWRDSNVYLVLRLW